MSEYRHLLAALERDDSGYEVLRRAQALALMLQVPLSVLHVLETVPVQSATIGDYDNPLLPPIDTGNVLHDAARSQFLPWCSELGIPEDAFEVIFDSVDAGIAEHAERIGADLIVIGRHQHRGLSSLFSHTENGVIGKARCDVLAVSLPGPTSAH